MKFVITLKRKSLENLMSINKRSDVQIVDGVDGKEIDWMTLSQKGRSDTFLYGRKMGPGEVGCALSHLKIYDNLITSTDLDTCITVFEDDIIELGYPFGWKDIIAKVPLRPEVPVVVLLGGMQGLRTRFLYNFLWKVNLIISGRLYLRIPKIISGHIYRTCCYQINRKAAEAIIRASRNGIRCADDWKGHITDGEIKLYYIPCFTHPSSLENSSIENDRC